MHSSVKELANAIWDSVADRLPGDDNGYYDPDAIVARALGIPKWHAIAARRGYRKAEPPRNITLPRVSIQERPYAEEDMHNRKPCRTASQRQEARRTATLVDGRYVSSAPVSFHRAPKGRVAQ